MIQYSMSPCQLTSLLAREVYTHMLKVREEQDPLSSSLTGEESSDTDNEDDEEYD